MNKHAKERLKKAVLGLLKTKKMENIQVKELCDYCGITRMTFYRHFDNLEALYFWIYLSILMDSLRMMMGALTLQQGLHARLCFLKKNSEFLCPFRTIRKPDCTSIVEKEYTQLSALLKSSLKQEKEIDRLCLMQLCAGWNSLLDDWVCHGMVQKAEKLFAAMLEMVPERLESLCRWHRSIAISSCLMGVFCKYNGGNNLFLPLHDLLQESAVLVCPEVLGGLSIPRPCSEIRHHRVINEKGQDVTEAFRCGAKKALQIAKERNCTLAILKEKSPSCGFRKVYDGTFTHTLTEGNGIAAELFDQSGIPVITEQEFQWIMSLRWE